MGSRKVIHWNRIKDIRSATATFIATAGGAGLVPFAPGTAGTLVGVPITYFIMDQNVWIKLGVWAVLSGVGTWSAYVFDQVMSTGDNQHIVIDEVVGFGVTALPLTVWAPKEWFVAFVLFRVFDILKLPPVRQMDQWSKTKGGVWGGFGVIADDLLAGVQGLLVMFLLKSLGFLSDF